MVLSLAFPIIPGVDCLRVIGVGEYEEAARAAAAAADDALEEEDELLLLEITYGVEAILSEPEMRKLIRNLQTSPGKLFIAGYWDFFSHTLSNMQRLKLQKGCLILSLGLL